MLRGIIVSVMLLAAATVWADDAPKVKMETTMGDVIIELYPDKAPITVENFLAYVNDGYYDGTIFHRVIKDFMNQGGGFLPGLNMKGDTKPPIKNEADNGLKNDKGTIAMARTSVVDSATCQFFINTKDNGFLNHKDKSNRGYGYAVFGKVVEGMDVMMNISKVPTGIVKRFRDVPKEDIVIKSIKVVK